MPPPLLRINHNLSTRGCTASSPTALPAFCLRFIVGAGFLISPIIEGKLSAFCDCGHYSAAGCVVCCDLRERRSSAEHSELPPLFPPVSPHFVANLRLFSQISETDVCEIKFQRSSSPQSFLNKDRTRFFFLQNNRWWLWSGCIAPTKKSAFLKSSTHSYQLIRRTESQRGENKKKCQRQNGSKYWALCFNPIKLILIKSCQT